MPESGSHLENGKLVCSRLVEHNLALQSQVPLPGKKSCSGPPIARRLAYGAQAALRLAPCR